MAGGIRSGEASLSDGVFRPGRKAHGGAAVRRDSRAMRVLCGRKTCGASAVPGTPGDTHSVLEKRLAVRQPCRGLRAMRVLCRKKGLQGHSVMCAPRREKGLQYDREEKKTRGVPARFPKR